MSTEHDWLRSRGAFDVKDQGDDVEAWRSLSESLQKEKAFLRYALRYVILNHHAGNPMTFAVGMAERILREEGISLESEV